MALGERDVCLPPPRWQILAILRRDVRQYGFGRLGWNNGRTESYAYTEVDQTAEL